MCGWILATCLLTWALVFSVLVVERQNHFGTYSFDLGVYDQSVYLLSRFKDPFITVRGLHQWGFHANFGLYLFVPFYWLGFGPNVLNVAMVLSFAAGAYPVYRIGRHYFRNPIYGLTFALLYLANPSLQFMAWETFHPDGMAILPLLFAWLFLLERRWKAFAVAAACAVLWKEDVALAIAAMGLFTVLFVRGHRVKGVITIVLAALYFQFINKVFLGHFNGNAAFYNTWFGALGDSPPKIAYNMVRHPDIVINALRDRYAAEYAWKMLTPFAWLPVLSPGVLMIGVPQFLANTLADQTFFRDYRYHYASVLLVGLTAAAIATVKTFGTNRGRRAVLMGLLVVCGVRTSVLWGLAPYSDNYDRGFWVHQAGPERRVPPRSGGDGAGRRDGGGHLQPAPARRPPGEDLRLPEPVDPDQLGHRRREHRRPGDGGLPLGRAPDARQLDRDVRRPHRRRVGSSRSCSTVTAWCWPSACAHPSRARCSPGRRPPSPRRRRNCRSRRRPRRCPPTPRRRLRPLRGRRPRARRHRSSPRTTPRRRPTSPPACRAAAEHRDRRRATPAR